MTASNLKSKENPDFKANVYDMCEKSEFEFA